MFEKLKKWANKNKSEIEAIKTLSSKNDDNRESDFCITKYYIDVSRIPCFKRRIYNIV